MSANTYDDPTLTKEDISEYESNRSNYFKGTIAVCVIYGIFAAGLFLIAIASPKGRDILANDLIWFVSAFIAGIIFIIIVLVAQVMSYKPTSSGKTIYDNMMCPDYWTLEKTPAAELRGLSAGEQYLLQYKCVNKNRAILNENTGTKYAAGARVPKVAADVGYKKSNVCPRDANNVLTKCADSDTKSVAARLTNLAKRMYAPSVYTPQQDPLNDAQVDCNSVFPYIMASDDTKHFPEQPNRLRCQYANICGVSWTNVCPTVYSTEL